MTELGGEGRGVWEVKKKLFNAAKSQFALELINKQFLGLKNQ